MKPIFQGEVMFLGWGDGLKCGPWIKLLLSDSDELDVFRGMTERKGKTAGQRLALVMVEIGDDDQPMQPGERPVHEAHVEPGLAPPVVYDESKPLPPKSSGGQLCNAMIRNGVFNSPQMLRAIGKDEDYLAWLRQQPSAVSGKFSTYTNGIGHCEAAHVRRIGNGSGTGYKPEFCAIPLTHDEHALQHQSGELRVLVEHHPNPGHFANDEDAKEWFTTAAAKYRCTWARRKLAQHLGAESLKDVEAQAIVDWMTARPYGDAGKTLAALLPRDV